MSHLEYAPLHPDFGARITGIDLREPLTSETVGEIVEAIDTYSLLVFPNQPFDDDRQLTFTRLLGEPEPDHVAMGNEGRTEYFGSIGNVQPDGSVLRAKDKTTIFLTGNNMWHTDASFKIVPAYVSIMCAYETPAEGGETLFVSTRAAYARLPDTKKAELDPLIGIHDYVYSRSKVAPDAVSPGLATHLPPVRQKLVRRNPRSGAPNLFIGSHVREIEGWSATDSRRLLDDLTAQATRPEHIYTLAWQPDDFVIWDNRALLHRGSGYDADLYRRNMRQTRVRGAGSSLEEV